MQNVIFIILNQHLLRSEIDKLILILDAVLKLILCPTRISFKWIVLIKFISFHNTPLSFSIKPNKPSLDLIKISFRKFNNKTCTYWKALSYSSSSVCGRIRWKPNSYTMFVPPSRRWRRQCLDVWMCFGVKQVGGWSRFLSEFSNNNIILPTAPKHKHKICFNRFWMREAKEAAEVYTNHIKDNGNKYFYFIHRNKRTLSGWETRYRLRLNNNPRERSWVGALLRCLQLEVGNHRRGPCQMSLSITERGKICSKKWAELWKDVQVSTLNLLEWNTPPFTRISLLWIFHPS